MSFHSMKASHTPDPVNPLHDQHAGAAEVSSDPGDFDRRVALKVGVEILGKGSSRWKGVTLGKLRQKSKMQWSEGGVQEEQ